MSFSKQSSLALYRRLFGYLKNYLRVFVVAVIGMIVVAATGPIFAWLLKPLINEGFVEKNLSAMRWVLLAIIGLFIVRGIFNFINEYSTSYMKATATRPMSRSRVLRWVSSVRMQPPRAELASGVRTWVVAPPVRRAGGAGQDRPTAVGLLAGAGGTPRPVRRSGVAVAGFR